MNFKLSLRVPPLKGFVSIPNRDFDEFQDDYGLDVYSFRIVSIPNRDFDEFQGKSDRNPY